MLEIVFSLKFTEFPMETFTLFETKTNFFASIDRITQITKQLAVKFLFVRQPWLLTVFNCN